MIRRLPVVITVFFGLGIILARFTGFLNAQVFLLFACGVLIAAIICGKKIFFLPLILSASFLLGTGIFRAAQVLPGNHIQKIFRQGFRISVIGIVAQQPVKKGYYWGFPLRLKRVSTGVLTYDCQGIVLVRVKQIHKFSPGEELRIFGEIKEPVNRYNIRRLYLVPRSLSDIESLRPAPRVSIAAFKNRLLDIFRRNLEEPYSSIVEAMVLGERRSIPALVSRAFLRTGTVHILVVSGFNVGIVAFGVMLILKIFRIKKGLRIFLVLAALIAYCLLTGASDPVLRATLMSGVYLAALILKREPDIYNSLAVAALIILTLDPRQLFDASFQLSFASVASIACIYPYLNKLLRLQKVRSRPLKLILEGGLVSLSAWAGTAGFIAYYFKGLSFAAIPANLFAVPLAALITLCGFALALINWLMPGLTPYFAQSTSFIVACLLKLNALMLNLPGAYISWR